METTLAKSTIEQLEGIVAQYPWFTAARIISVQKNGSTDPQLALQLSLCGVPAMLLRQPLQTDFLRGDTVELIDHFLTHADVRIKPPEIPDHKDLSLDSITEDPDLVSEELAEIFLRQGQKAKAKAIYTKLCLLYPEKSVYFAGIMAELK